MVLLWIEPSLHGGSLKITSMQSQFNKKRKKIIEFVGNLRSQLVPICSAVLTFIFICIYFAYLSVSWFVCIHKRQNGWTDWAQILFEKYQNLKKLASNKIRFSRMIYTLEKKTQRERLNQRSRSSLDSTFTQIDIGTDRHRDR